MKGGVSTKMISQPGLYILNSRGIPVRESNPICWAKWIGCPKNRILKFDALQGDVEVSTIYLGIDRNWSTRGRPLLWETMIFGGRHHGYQEGHASRTDALAGHVAALKIARGQSPRVRA